MDCGRGSLVKNLWTDVDENFRIHTPPLLTETDTRRTTPEWESSEVGTMWVAGASRAARATHVVPAPLLHRGWPRELTEAGYLTSGKPHCRLM